MLRELIIKVRAKEDGHLQFHNAAYIHGLFFKMINEKDNEYSVQLHNKDDLKPFTISNMHSANATEKNYLICKEKTYPIRVTFIDHITYSIFIATILKYQTNGREFNIGKLRFIIDEIEVKNTLTIGEIVNGKPNYNKNFQIEFSSPTAFKRNGINHLMPEPYSIFKSYSSKWNMYFEADVKISEEEFMEIEKSCYITKYKLETQIIEMDRYKMVGFKGRCTYDFIKEIDENILRKVNYLLKFAPYCGTGYKTTMGMGQTRIIT